MIHLEQTDLHISFYDKKNVTCSKLKMVLFIQAEYHYNVSKTDFLGVNVHSMCCVQASLC